MRYCRFGMLSGANSTKSSRSIKQTASVISFQLKILVYCSKALLSIHQALPQDRSPAWRPQYTVFCILLLLSRPYTTHLSPLVPPTCWSPVILPVRAGAVKKSQTNRSGPKLCFFQVTNLCEQYNESIILAGC